MDIVDALSKIRKLEKEIEELKKELKKSKNEVKLLKSIEERYLDEFEKLSHLLAKYAPFDDYDEVIVDLNKIL